MRKNLLLIIAFLYTVAQGTWAQTTVTTEGELRAAIQTDGANIKLGGNIELTDKLIIDGKTVTIDLNGHKLYRDPNLLASHPDDNVINVDNGSNLTLTSSVSGGSIEGGLNEQGGGGIRIPSGNTVSVSNIAFQVNFSKGNGGAIWNSGTLTVSDCTFYLCIADKGAAIWNNGTLNMQGAIVMTDNKDYEYEPNHLYMKSGTVINVTGSLAGSSIGISSEDEYPTFTSGYATYNEGIAPSTYFSPDISVTKQVSADQDGEACLTLKDGCIPYVERGWDGKKVTSTTKILTPNSYSLLESSKSGFWVYNGFYVVKGNVAIDGTLIVFSEDCKIILCDDATLTVQSIVLLSRDGDLPYVRILNNGAKLSIFAQPGGTGRLIAGGSTKYSAIGTIGLNDYNNDVLSIHGGIIEATSPGGCAGIGTFGDNSLQIDNFWFGAINIYGGTITARGGSGAAGIGSGSNSDTNKNYGTINIYGGNVTAYGGSGASGIGGGTNNENENNRDALNIYGGTVNAYGGSGAAGIGGGNGYYVRTKPTTITISGGTVVATGAGDGPGIGGSSVGDNVTITGGTLVVKAGTQEGPDKGYRAIGSGKGSSKLGSLVFANNMGIKYGIDGQYEYHGLSGSRVDNCRKYPFVKIGPCKHPGAIITITDASSHNVNCQLCKITSEAHSFGDYGECPACHLVCLADNADNSDIIAHWNNTIKSVTLNGRTLTKNDKWNTLCLPYDLSAEQLATSPLAGCTLKELDVYETYDTDKKTGFDEATGTLNLYFKTATSIEAGKAYLIKWSSGSGTIENPTFSNVTIADVQPDVTSADGKVSFKGIYSPKAITDEDKTMLYLGANNKLYYPNAAMTINACRGYFRLNDITAGDVANARMFSGDEDVTGIDTMYDVRSKMEDGRSKMEDVWHTIDGRKLQGKPTQKGVYINKGRKVVIK